MLLITITKVCSNTLLKTKKVEAEKLESRHNFKLNKMKPLIIIIIVIALTSCGASKNCHCNCDAYGQVSIDKDIKTAK